MSEEAHVVVWSLAIIGVTLIGGILWNSAACNAKWTRSGFESDYGIIQGCVIKVKGRWIPEERYRDLDE